MSNEAIVRDRARPLSSWQNMPSWFYPKLLPPVAMAMSIVGLPIQAADAASLYARWPNGPPQDPSFFPIAVWRQQPRATRGNGHDTNAAAAASEHINIFLGLSGVTGKSGVWPERFGGDSGELELLKANKLYVIGGVRTPSEENTSAGSVASMLALAKSIGAERNLIGYQAADEPACVAGRPDRNGFNYPPSAVDAPAVVHGIQHFDPTRVVAYNHADWMTSPQLRKCLPESVAALQAASIASVDNYVMARPYIRWTDIAKSDFVSIPNDKFFLQGLETRALRHFARPDQPVWMFVESGSDNFGGSEANNNLVASVAVGSNILVNASAWSIFTSTWVGLSVSGPGIPANTKIVKIVDSSHAVMSAAATETGEKERVKITGGVNDSDCVVRVNLCVVNGNEYRATTSQVNSEVWASIINGANGIEYFCHDRTAIDFCLGSPKGGQAAEITAKNLSYINKTVLSYAPVLNSPTVGECSLLQENYETGARSRSSSCSNGMLKLQTRDATESGMAMVKKLGGVTYLFAQPDRRHPTGITLTMTLIGLSGRSATVVYDSNAQYDPAHASTGRTLALDASGALTDTLGAYGDDYQVKIYAIR